jgi:class 3 adenylate cyclase
MGAPFPAVCGVPKPDLEHAVHMARFAMAAIIRFYEVIKRLELTLGPDTVGESTRTPFMRVASCCALQQSHDQPPLHRLDLGMRIGMHSGPVTAGVLRGDRARFQLFGDTVNTGRQFAIQICLSLLMCAL